MNSDNLAKIVALAFVATKLVLSWEQMSDVHWALYLLWVPVFWMLYQFLITIIDAVTGKPYIKTMHHYREVKIYRNQPIEYCINLGFALSPTITILYMMFWIIP